MSFAELNRDTAKKRSIRIAQVLAEVAKQRQSGAEVSDDQVCAAYADLMPELAEGLKHLPVVARARERAPKAPPVETESARPVPAALGGAVSADSFAGYAIIKEVHRGGQGVVYQAIQKSTKRKVALKVMKEGPFATAAEQARFEREVQVLGQLNHPNIVAIHDSGQAAGCQYFVMDYISGQPLDVWMAGRTHSIENTLKLFTKICSAVNAAHLRGITHRDLKPSNIRIDENAEPHILDFGLAKVAHSAEEASLMTLTGQFMGSLPWASPEQAEGIPSKIDIRTDVYSLGVILYQMLTGKFPYEVIGNMRDVLDRIMRAEPVRPSTIGWHGRPGRGINDEVETIVLKCLAKERERRYQSAGELARDVGHYLTGEPIEAKRDSAAYVLRKYMRKYWVPTAVAAGFVVVVTVGLIGSLTFWREAVLQRGHAEQSRLVAEERRVAAERSLAAESVARGEAEAAHVAERQRADELKQVADFQAKQLAGIDVPLMAVRLRRGLLDRVRAAGEKSGMDEAAIAERAAACEKLLAGADLTGLSLALLDENIFARALTAIEKQFADQPLIKARLLQTVAEVLQKLGLLDAATAPQTEALSIRRAQLGDEDPDTLTSINTMAMLLKAQGNLSEAERYCREVLESARRVLGPDHLDTLTYMSNAGRLLQEQGKLSEAQPYYREALESARRVLGNDHPETLTAIGNMGGLFQAQGKLSEAESYYREVLERARRVLGDDHPDTRASINNMALLLQAQGKLAEAEPYLREALESARRVLGDDHPHTLTCINNTGYLLLAQGKVAEAERYYREALESRRRILGDDHPETLISINNMGALRRAQGKLTEAEPYYREALERARRVLGDDHPKTLTAINNLAMLLQAQGKLSEAESYLREALESARRVLGDDHPQTLTCVNNMGLLLHGQGKLSEAEPYLREALVSRRRVLGDDHPDTLTSMNNMGALLKAYGNLSEAEPYYSEALERACRVLGDDHPDTLAYISNLGSLLQAQGKLTEAEALLLPAVAMADTKLPERHPVKGKLSKTLAKLYRAWDQAEPGKGFDLKAAEWQAKLDQWQASTQPALIQP